MTDRLTQLLTREADGLDVPPPPSAAVLDRGRGLRRRRRAASGVAAVAVLAVVGTSLALLTVGGDRDDRRVDPAEGPTPGAGVGAVFSVGNRVYLDGGSRSVTIDDPSVKSFYYTSAGLVVRQGDNPYSDGGGLQRFSLVTPDGAVRPMALATEEVYHAADPAQPYLVYADRADGVLTAVVLDVRTEEEVLVVPLPEHSDGFAPVSLSGDTLYVGDPEQERTFEVDVPSGEVEVATGEEAYVDVAGGHAVSQSAKGPIVVDVATGETLLEVPSPADAYTFVSLSPDGRYAEVVGTDPETFEPAPSLVHDLVTGESVELPAQPAGAEMYGHGWTSDSTGLFDVSATGEVRTCSGASGTCTTTRPPLAVLPDEYRTGGDDGGADDLRDDLKVGGRLYES